MNIQSWFSLGLTALILYIYMHMLNHLSYLTLCDPVDVAHQAPLSMRVLQARILEWVALPSFRGSSWPWDQARISCISCRSRFFTGRFFTPEPPRKPVVLVLKNPPANAGDIEDLGSFPRSGRSMEEGMAAHCSILAWRIPWTEEPGRLWSIASQRVGHV